MIDITAFGAVGDGVTDDTAAIQRAIDACECGRVVVPRGRFLTGTLRLHSNLELHLCAGGELYAAHDYAAYPPIVSDVWNIEYAPRKNSRCLLYAESAANISITGEGSIECHGLDWCEPDPSEGRINEYRRRTGEVIPRVLMMVDCDHFELRDFCIHDSPAGWAAWLVNCRDGVVDGMRILSDRKMPNADGLHLNCCRDVLVTNCRFDTGDDALILRAYTSVLKAPVPCERITVRNCRLGSHSSAVRIGWCNDFIIRDCSISDCTVEDSVNGLVIQLPSFPQRVADQGTDEVVVERITFANITMRRVLFEPVHITALPGSGAKCIRDLQFINIDSESRLPIRMQSPPDVPIENVTFTDCDFRIVKDMQTRVPIPKQYWNQSAYTD